MGLPPRYEYLKRKARQEGDRFMKKASKRLKKYDKMKKKLDVKRMELLKIFNKKAKKKNNISNSPFANLSFLINSFKKNTISKYFNSKSASTIKSNNCYGDPVDLSLFTNTGCNYNYKYFQNCSDASDLKNECKFEVSNQNTINNGFNNGSFLAKESFQKSNDNLIPRVTIENLFKQTPIAFNQNNELFYKNCDSGQTTIINLPSENTPIINSNVIQSKIFGCDNNFLPYEFNNDNYHPNTPKNIPESLNNINYNDNFNLNLKINCPTEQVLPLDAGHSLEINKENQKWMCSTQLNKKR